jgi:hypothetical protein
VYFRRSLFWDITQRRLVAAYRRFGTKYRSNFKDYFTLEDGIDSLSRNVGNKLQPTLRNIPEERRPQSPYCTNIRIEYLRCVPAHGPLAVMANIVFNCICSCPCRALTMTASVDTVIATEWRICDGQPTGRWLSLQYESGKMWQSLLHQPTVASTNRITLIDWSNNYSIKVRTDNVLTDEAAK